MKVNEVRAATKKDFDKFKSLVEKEEEWTLEYNKGLLKVWTKPNELSNFKMVKASTAFQDVTADTMYDVIHDPQYRRMWDPNIIEGKEICQIDAFNDIGYYSMSLPHPLANRDFVTQRSWMNDGLEKIIFNHSVNHAAAPITKGFVRGISYLTGYLIKSTSGDAAKPGCHVTYLTQCDPRGSLPSWAVNRTTQWVAPRVIQRLQKLCIGYDKWKAENNPDYKPWLKPEQNRLPFLKPQDVAIVPSAISGSVRINVDQLAPDENDVREDELSSDETRLPTVKI